MKKGLTQRRKRFCQEYIIDLNGTQAAIRAGYSQRTANEQAARLLANVSVQAEIQKALQKRAERTEITQDKVLNELAKLGFSDMKNFTKWSKDGVVLKDSEELTPEQSACVAEVSETISKGGGSIKFKLHDKVSALEKIGRHLGMFNDKIVLEGDIKIKAEFKDIEKDDKG